MNAHEQPATKASLEFDLVGRDPVCGMAVDPVTAKHNHTHDGTVFSFFSAATMANIRQNLFFAFIYNAAGIPVAAGVLYPKFGVLLSPVVAAAAMSLSSVSVIANALRLRRIRL